MQKTIQKEISQEGIGIHTGKTVKLKYKPAGENTGIVFKRVDLPDSPSISIKDYDYGAQERRTVISKNGAEINTIEHLMAALWALEIDNIMVEVDSPELPGLDGSAADFYNTVKTAGIRELDAPKKEIEIKEPVWCEKNDAFVGIFPSKNFKISYILESPHPAIQKQVYSSELTPEKAAKEIINARTFCLKEEAEMLLKMGFGKGANTKNTLVMDINGPMDNALRYSDELARHKVLDLLGDLYLLGAPLIGRVIAIRSGHALNGELVKKIKEKGWL